MVQILAALLIFVPQVSAQETVADSLAAELTGAGGTERVDILNRLGNISLSSDLAQARDYADTALSESNDLGYDFGRAGALCTIGRFLHMTGHAEEAVATYHEALDLIGSDPGLNLTGLLHSRMGYALDDLERETEAIDSMKRGLPILAATEDRPSEGYIANYIGLLHWQRSEYDSALVYYHRSLDIREEVGTRRSEATTLNNIGIIHYQQGNYQQAVDYYLRSFRIHEEIDNIYGAALALNNLGITYRDWGEFDTALEYFRNGLAMAEHIQNAMAIGYSLNNIGSAFERKAVLDSARVYYEWSLDEYTAGDEASGMMLANNSLGNLYNLIGSHERGLDHARAALAIADSLGNIEHRAMALSRIGHSQMHLGMLLEARAHFLQSMALCREMGKRDLIKDNFYHLYELSESEGDTGAALDYFIRYSSLKDSLFNEESARNIEHLRISFDTGRKEQENEQLRRERTIQEAVIRRNRTIIVLISALLAIIALSSVVVYSLYRTRTGHIPRSKPPTRKSGARTDESRNRSVNSRRPSGT